MATTTTLGPIELADGVTRRHTLCYLFAAFVSIGLFTYLVQLTPYILRNNLGLPEDSFGRLVGDIQFWQEVTVLCVIGWFGALSDRFGRRTVYVLGFILMGLAYLLYALASSIEQLIAFRLIFALAIAANSAMLAAVVADYPAEKSRGKLAGISMLLNGLGATIFSATLTRLPNFYLQFTNDTVVAGQYACFTVAGIAFFAAVVMLGLKPGLPTSATNSRPSVIQLMREGLRAAGNRRIAVSYLGSFAARADMSIITLFLILWVQTAGVAAGMSDAEALAKAGSTMAIVMICSVFWAPLFGILADRINRLLLVSIGFLLATAGYGWVSLQSDILASSTIPALILMGIGQSSTILSVTVLLGQESPPAIRGSTFGMQSFFGAIGILLMSVIGGRLFDAFGGQAPFYAIALANGLVMLAAIGQQLIEKQGALRQTV